MKKCFEDQLMEIQSDMIFTCLEYAKHKVDKVFVHVIIFSGHLSCEYFYEKNGKIYNRDELGKISQEYDTSIERQNRCFDALFDNAFKLMNLFDDNSRKVPADIKLIYDTKTEAFNADFDYDVDEELYSSLLAFELTQNWIDMIKINLEKEQKDEC